MRKDQYIPEVILVIASLVLVLLVFTGCTMPQNGWDFSPAKNGTNWGSVRYHENRLDRNKDRHTVVTIER